MEKQKGEYDQGVSHDGHSRNVDHLEALAGYCGKPVQSKVRLLPGSFDVRGFNVIWASV